LNLLVYLNREWRDEWDGSFEVWDPPVKKRTHRFVPEFNRCVIFGTTTESFHAVSAIRCPPERNRISFAVYYYTEEAPEDWDGIRRSTVYKARPEEWFKGYVQMPWEFVKWKVEKTFRRISYHLPGRARGAQPGDQE
jgi:Rps23 Pro-64 3,4-dihydroxylase Tpa1-like proline 4-hydroxylase